MDFYHKHPSTMENMDVVAQAPPSFYDWTQSVSGTMDYSYVLLETLDREIENLSHRLLDLKSQRASVQDFIRKFDGEPEDPKTSSAPILESKVEWLKVDAFAEKLGKSVSWVNLNRRNGNIPHFRVENNRYEYAYPQEVSE